MPERLPHSSSTPEQVSNEPIPRPLQWIKDNGLLITGLLLLGLLFFLIAHYSSIRIDWPTTHAFTGSIQNVVQVLALCAGGCWAYFKFIKGRTFQESLTPAVTGRFVALDGVVYLIATIQIKNVGSSRIDFDRQTSALVLYEYTQSLDTEVHAVKNKRLTSFNVFEREKERYVEPNETIEVQQFISIPGPLKLAYRLEADILSTSGFIWRAASIVDKASLRDNAAGLVGL
jgi:hypothetical protein